MTTAHRPTWAPAKGHEEQGGNRLYFNSSAKSAKDIAGFKQVKYRKVGQAAGSELQDRDLKAELEIKEKTHFDKKRNFEEERQRDLLLIEMGPGAAAGGGPAGRLGSAGPPGGARGAGGGSDADDDDEEGAGGAGGKILVPQAADADDEDASEGGSDSDDSDDEAALLAELSRIKKEREEEARRKAEEEARDVEEGRKAEVLGDNPLLQRGDPGFSLKRRWDDDVVFKNQSRDEPKPQKKFINDTIRSQFHKQFLNRYIK